MFSLTVVCFVCNNAVIYPIQLLCEILFKPLLMHRKLGENDNIEKSKTKFELKSFRAEPGNKIANKGANMVIQRRI